MLIYFINQCTDIYFLFKEKCCKKTMYKKDIYCPLIAQKWLLEVYAELSVSSLVYVLQLLLSVPVMSWTLWESVMHSSKNKEWNLTVTGILMDF